MELILIISTILIFIFAVQIIADLIFDRYKGFYEENRKTNIDSATISLMRKTDLY